MKTRIATVAWFAFAGAVVLGGGIVGVSSQTAYAQVVTSARCSNCRRAVPTWSRAGHTCPHCGAYWSTEEHTYEAGYRYTPRPTPYEIWLMRQAQMAQARKLQRERKKAERIERVQKQREQILAERQANWARLSEITREYRANFNREEEADKQLQTALRVHGHGNSRTAASYCRVIVKNYSDTRAASAAKSLLAQIGH